MIKRIESSNHARTTHIHSTHYMRTLKDFKHKEKNIKRKLQKTLAFTFEYDIIRV